MMADENTLVIDLTVEERQRIEMLAHKRGYAEPQDYLLALVNLDADSDQITDEKTQLIADFREAWHDALSGNIRPIEELWNDMDNND
jgi:hypothetical protein